MNLRAWTTTHVNSVLGRSPKIIHMLRIIIVATRVSFDLTIAPLCTVTFLLNNPSLNYLPP